MSESNALMTSLSTIAEEMASDISPVFQNATVDRYSGFLDAMYHYTLESERELLYASTIAPTEDLRELFAHMAKDEQAHYKLAELDLRELDCGVGLQAPDAVLILREFWMSETSERFFELLGALYAVENVGGFVKSQALQCLMALQLRPKQCRFVAVHLEVDEDHGSLMSDACRKYGADHADAILEGARKAAALWTEMHLGVLDIRGAA